MLEKDIAEAIQKNLSAEVGTQLKNRLAKAETDAELVVSLTKQLADEKIRVANLDKIVYSYKDIESREQLVKINEEAIREATWKLKVQEAELKGRESGMNQNFEVVKAVFANNIMKYQHNDKSYGYANGHNTNSEHTVTGMKEG